MNKKIMLYRKAICLFVLTLFLYSTEANAQAKKTGSRNEVAAPRILKDINLHWTFNYFPDEKADRLNIQAPGYNDSKWPEVAVPHSWQLYETTGEVHPFIRNPAESDNDYWWKGWGWYRKHFIIEPSQKDKKIFIEFDGVMKYCKVFINGMYLGDHKGGYGSFDFDITSYIKPGQDNVLAIAVNNLRVDPFKTPPMKAGNWNTYGGIIRDVRLVLKSPLYIPMQGSASHEGGTFITTPKVSAKEALVRVQTHVQNDYPVDKKCTVKTTIVDSNNKMIQRFEQTAIIPARSLYTFDQQSKPVLNPKLWAPGASYLYKVYTEIYDGATVADQMTSPLGFRWFHWNYKENFLYVNGKKVVLHGGNRHEEYPWLGQAVPKWITEADYHDMAVNLNYNFMRTAHYPNAPHVYDLTDQYGIVIDEELPNDKNQEFAKEVQEQQLKEMIRRDRNHPSIFFWSMGNETNHAADSKWTLAEDTTRIVTARRVLDHSEGDYAPHSDKNLPLESLLACNIRGWYNADVKNLEPTDGQHAGTEENQHRKLIASGRLANGNLSTWLYADHGCDREYLNEPVLHVNPKGYVDAYRMPKYSYYLWQANYLERPMVWIMPHFWQSRYLGQKKDITVDANGEKVELFVNGKSQGVLVPSAQNFRSVTFRDVEVQKGEIKAVTTRNGKTATYRLVMSGKPVRLVLTASHQSVPSAKSTVVVVKADVVDEKGVHVFGASNPLKWSVKGPATLAGPENYTSDIDKNEEMDGTMYIDAPVSNLVRSTGEPGTITVTVQSPNLSSASVTIRAYPLVETATGVIEPRVVKAERSKVALNPGNSSSAVVRVPEVIRQSFDEFHYPGKSKAFYTGFITKYMVSQNKNLDTTSLAFKSLVELFASHMLNNDGRLVADDYNFNIDHFNKVLYLDGVIEKTALPSLFKASLKKAYASALITKGIEQNLNTEQALINAIPVKGTLVVAGSSRVQDPSVKVVASANLDAIMGEVYKNALTDSASYSAVKSFLAQINPFIAETITNSRIRGEEKKTVVLYSVTENEMLWLPDVALVPKKSKEKKEKNKTED